MNVELTLPAWAVIVILILVLGALLASGTLAVRLTRENVHLEKQERQWLKKADELAIENRDLRAVSKVKDIPVGMSGALFDFTTEPQELSDDKEIEPKSGRALVVFDDPTLSDDVVEWLADSLMSGEWNRMHMSIWQGVGERVERN